ncbi:flavodoxin family protein [Blastococcus tunisiensis]|uniref:Flavodoxin n=1 Tax=Blastococcus tunisiensis TaxID=1798228 RepID=A0A1I2B3P3_9ACTN|nr:flavodoxin family protein [Blastococcus sp. DSM 46838]SFE49893.1 Flavodoxin [Blastococcus sp. DSM 46838]
MARALVVYESVFGDAKKIALAIAEGLAARLQVDVASARDAPHQVPGDVRLLVVGGPTHAFGMPKESTREGAVTQYGAEIPDTGLGLHEWLDRAQLPPHVNAAAFDTRMDHPKLITRLDHASKTEEKLLRGLGATLAAPAEHFFVTDAKGPLVEGEEDRARQWGTALGELVAARPANASG